MIGSTVPGVEIAIAVVNALAAVAAVLLAYWIYRLDELHTLHIHATRAVDTDRGRCETTGRPV